MAAFGPILAFALGFLSPLFWPGLNDIYLEALPVMVLALAVAFFSGTMGAMLVLGYAAGDLLTAFDVLRTARVSDYHPLVAAFLLIGGPVIAWLLLGFAALVVPQVSRRLAMDGAARLGLSQGVRFGVATLTYSVLAVILVFLWSQAMVLLMGPVFTWVRTTPSVEAMSAVQSGWPWLIVGSLLGIGARFALQLFAPRRRDWVSLAGDLARRRAERLRRVQTARALSRSLPPLARPLGEASVITLVLSGIYVDILDALIAFVVVLGFAAWHAGFILRTPATWATALERIPPILRFAGAIVAGYLIALVLNTALFELRTARVVLVSALIMLVLFYLLFPPGLQRRPSAPEPATQGGTK